MRQVTITFDITAMNPAKKVQPQISKQLRTLASQLREFGIPEHATISDDRAHTIGTITSK